MVRVAASDQGTDILPAMGVAGDGATGFTGPLAAGLYSVWVDDDKPFNYDFQIGVPEPATWAMMMAGFVGLGLLGYRQRRRVSLT
jgi:PEP-CTERM motif